jgi:hypothetical protein
MCANGTPGFVDLSRGHEGGWISSWMGFRKWGRAFITLFRRPRVPAGPPPRKVPGHHTELSAARPRPVSGGLWCADAEAGAILACALRNRMDNV